MRHPCAYCGAPLDDCTARATVGYGPCCALHNHPGADR